MSRRTGHVSFRLAFCLTALERPFRRTGAGKGADMSDGIKDEPLHHQHCISSNKDAQTLETVSILTSIARDAAMTESRLVMFIARMALSTAYADPKNNMLSYLDEICKCQRKVLSMG